MGIFDKFINKILDTEIPFTGEINRERTKNTDKDSDPFSMKIDDVFSIAGRGTVVIGKVETGSIQLNDKITVISGSQKKNTKVVSIEKFNKLVSTAKAGEEIGLLLDKINQNEVKKGYIVTKDENAPLLNINPQVSQVIYSEREIPDDSTEALAIKARVQEEGEEIYESVIHDLPICGFFKPERLGELEKRIEGIKTGDRWKIPAKEITEYLSDLGLSQEDPVELLSNIYYQNYHKVGRKRDLARMKSIGIKKVEISDCGDERDCSKIKRLKKVWPIDQVPELPLPGCTAEYCRCSFVAYDVFE